MHEDPGFQRGMAVQQSGGAMIEFRDTGLPADAEVFKAFSMWRQNAADFAAKSGLDENFPVQVAQVLYTADPADRQLVALALLMPVPATAWGLVEKRFDRETVEALGEAWTHVRTGYAYAGDASEKVKALALAAAIASFDAFIKNADMTLQTVTTKVQMGEEPGAIIKSLLGGDCKRYERLAETIKGSAHPALEGQYAETLAAYFSAKDEQKQQLAALGVMIADDDDEETGETNTPRALRAGPVAFEDTGLPDDPLVRAAYALVSTHSRVTPRNFADAVSAGKMLAGAGDAVTVAAGMVDAAIRDLNAEDYGFLAKKLDPAVMDILCNYNLTTDFLMRPEHIAEGPRSVRQMALARGILMLDHAREQSGDLLKRVERLAGEVPPEVGAQLKEQSLQPARVVSQIVPLALAPVFGDTGAPALEKLFAQRMQALDDFIETQTMSGGPMVGAPPLPGRRRPTPGPGL
jgi:hypothetical protein